MNDKLHYERELLSRGYKYIAGVDEVGRGPLAGPVVAACVIMDLQKIVEGVDDSKKLSEKKRERLLGEIKNGAVCYCVGVVDEREIDRINILNATKKAMAEAINSMEIAPDYILCDAIDSLDITQEIMGIVKGDSLSYSIGAASIIAKQTRDSMMIDYAEIYPEYGFERHKGYGTAQHRKALVEYGPCAIHRATFIRKILGKADG
jgi:ribonuclease HII